MLRLEDTEKDKETLKQTISQLEETKRQQERALEKLTKEVRRGSCLCNCIVVACIHLLFRGITAPSLSPLSV